MIPLLEWILPASLAFSVLLAVWGAALLAAKIPHGSAFGPRMPETLAEPEAWRAASRILGRGVFLGALALALANLYYAQSLAVVLAAAGVLLAAPPLATHYAKHAARAAYHRLHGEAPPVRVGADRYLPGKR